MGPATKAELPEAFHYMQIACKACDAGEEGARYPSDVACQCARNHWAL